MNNLTTNQNQILPNHCLLNGDQKKLASLPPLLRVFLLALLLIVSWGSVFSSSTMAQEAQDVQEQVAIASGEGEAWFPNEFFGVPVFDDDIYKMIVRFGFNLFFLLLVVVISYVPHQKSNPRYVFNFLIMNVVVFFICFTLKKLELELGMALGLFAIFAIIRYRTDQIDVKDMTYLFVVIGLAVINALSNKKTSYIELVFTNAAIFACTLIMERVLSTRVKPPKLMSREIVYDKLDLLHPSRAADLRQDLMERTGVDATRIDIKKVDLKTETATVVLKFPKPSDRKPG